MANGITIRLKHGFIKTKNYFYRMRNRNIISILHRYGAMGVDALRNATPRDSGETAASWTYEIETDRKTSSIVFVNTNVNKGVNIAIILQYGHGTRNGGYVAGRDYINPAIQPVFDKMAEDVWKEVAKNAE